MAIFSIIAVFLTIAALLSYINYRFVRLPSTVGLMMIALTLSLCLIGLGKLGFGIEEQAGRFLTGIDFSETLMKGMLSFLLFAGALKINLEDLSEQKYIVGGLATVGVVATTFMVGTALYFAFQVLDVQLSFMYCLVFGALIAPTDPVAVMAILKSVKAPRSLETKIAGESLFNDGVGVVVFLVMVGIATGGATTGIDTVLVLFLKEAVGGVVFGFAIGWAAYRLLKNVDDYSVEILITLALVSGGYALATAIHTSGPIAIVVAGLMIGNHGRMYAMSDVTRDHLDTFWKLIDEILNAVLFAWIGLEILVLAFSWSYFVAGLVAIPLSLLARFVSVSAFVGLLRFRRQFSQNAIRILTWGGLRGGISIALALSLAAGEARDLIVAVTYVVVAFSVLVQGSTVKRLVQM
ncbi:MAG: sodium:proton antiporter [Candidatus Zixiibacteriota bacterium]|nr:MAG: sodium:proton antiporter [candidate division Zixibacteria bacterium]